MDFNDCEIEKYKKDIYDITSKYIVDQVNNKFYCYDTMRALECIIKIILNFYDQEKKNKVNIDINTWFTNSRFLSVTSAEGFAIRSGLRNIDNALVVKVSKYIRDRGLIHEYLVGKELNKFRQLIPNFMYVLALYNCGNIKVLNPISKKQIKLNYYDSIHVNDKSYKKDIIELCKDKQYTEYLISEFINGKPLSEFINDNENNNINYEDDLYNIIFQTLYSLQIAIDLINFRHYDLHSTNVMVRNISEKTYLKYYKNNYILTDKIATIIDYGRSCITINNKNLGLSFGYEEYGVDLNENNYGIDLFKFITTIARDLKNVYSPLFNNFYDIFCKFLIQKSSNYKTKYIIMSDLLDEDSSTVKHFWYPRKPDQGIYNLQPKDLISYIQKNYKNLFNKHISLNMDKKYKELLCIKKLKPILKNTFFKQIYCDYNKWFECGEFKYVKSLHYFVLNSKVSLYKNSIEMTYYNVEYPLGIDYYKAGHILLTENDINKLKRETRQLKDRRKFIIDIQSKLTSQGFILYGNYDYAIKDSIDYKEDSIKIDNNEIKCDKYCISAYKIQDNLNIIDLTDIDTLINLLTKKEFSIYMENLHGKDTIIKFIKNKDFNVFRSSKYLVDKDIIDVNITRIIDGYINPNLNYIDNIDKYDYTQLILKYKSIGVIQRDYNNPKDWQYSDNNRLFGEIGNLVKDMYKYSTTNIDLYSGDLYQHSVWTALYIQYMFSINHPFTQGIPEEMMHFVILCGFLHDIGKGGDMLYLYYNKEDNPKKGFEYFKQINKYMYKDNDGNLKILDIPELLKNIDINEKYYYLIPIIILSHMEFLESVKKIHDGSNIRNIAKEYIKKIEENMTESNSLITNTSHEIFYSFDVKTLINIIILISICDIKATQPFIENKIEKKNTGDIIKNFNNYIKDYEYLTNQSKKYHGKDLYKSLDIENIGLQLKKEINYILWFKSYGLGWFV